jgi:phosphoribosylformylglycinamidine synthase
MKFGVVTFPGSNCDEDMVYVLQDIMGQKVERLWHKDTDLKGADFVVLPGGFSFGDYLRSGAIAKLSPIMTEVINHANKGGFVLGVCNGFQILTESGLLEGALLHNNNQKFICKNVFLKPTSESAAISKGLSADRTFKIPIAHGEGRFFASDDTIKKIEDNNW